MATMKDTCPDIPPGRPAILVMGRLPEAGRVKTRLARVYGEDTALILHTAFLKDTLATAADAAASLGGQAVFAYEGDGPPSRHGLTQVDSFPQSPGDLGHRQSAAQEDVFNHGAGCVITVGSDSPTLPRSLFADAWSVCETADVVVAPAADGGYVLIAHTGQQPGLYNGLPWGTHGVMGGLTDRARELDMRLHCLPGWYDVDDETGLCRLRREISADPGLAPHTAAALATLSLGPCR